MSNNVSKKLALKAELLKHLTTAEKMRDEGVSSSGLRMILLALDIALVDRDQENHVDMQFWKDVMA